MAEIITTTFKLRRGTLQEWENKNPILADGEPGWAIDAKILKIGDGKTTWKDLQMADPGEVGKFTDNGGEIFNDYENNMALSTKSSAKGAALILHPDVDTTTYQGNIAGCYGYKVINTQYNESNKNWTITLDTNCEYIKDDIICFSGKSHYYNQLQIVEVNGLEIVVTRYSEPNLPCLITDTVMPKALNVESDDPDNLENWIFCVNKPTIGVSNPYSKGASSEGEGTIAVGRGASSTGRETKAIGHYAHAEGRRSQANYSSHAEGIDAKAMGRNSHAEGNNSASIGENSHAEGRGTRTIGENSHAEGRDTYAEGTASHTEGSNTQALKQNSHAEGLGTIASGAQQHVQGKYNKSDYKQAHIVGNGNSDTDRSNAHTLDWDGNAWYAGKITIGADKSPVLTETEINTKLQNHRITAGKLEDTTLGSYATAEGYGVIASGTYSHAEGRNSKATGNYGSHAEGDGTVASGSRSHAEGAGTQAIGKASHAEGNNTIAGEKYLDAEGKEQVTTNSHAEGYNTKALGTNSHAEGKATTAKGEQSHAEGYLTYANDDASHAEGSSTQAVGQASHAEGNNTIAFDNYSHAAGKYNAIYEIKETDGWINIPKEGKVWTLENINIDQLNGLFKVTYDKNVKEYENRQDIPYIDENDEPISYAFTFDEITADGPNTTTTIFTEYQGDYYTYTLVKNSSAVSIGGGSGESKYTLSDGQFIAKTSRKNIYNLDWEGNAKFAGGIELGGAIQAPQGKLYAKNMFVVTYYDENFPEDTEWDTVAPTSFVKDYYKENKVGTPRKYSNTEFVQGEIFNHYDLDDDGIPGNIAGYAAHAEGFRTEATGGYSHSEGHFTKANGLASHVEGYGNNKMFDLYEEDIYTEAKGQGSHAEGFCTIATGKYQHVQGQLNIEDEENKYAHIVGNGYPDYGPEDDPYPDAVPHRSNAHTLDWDGNAWYAGHIEATAIILTSPNGTKFKVTVSNGGTLETQIYTE